MAVFEASHALARGFELLSRALAYAAAGLLTRDQLRGVIARRWSGFGETRTFVLSGLFPWEEELYRRFLKAEDEILVVGSGSGRDLLALRLQGYRAAGLEPATAAAETARAMLREAGLPTEVRVGAIETMPLGRAYDLYIFSWFCYSYLPERAVRVAALRAARAHLTPGGRILVSYVPRTAPPRRLPRAITAAVARLTGRHAEATDVISLESGGLHFEHQFLPGEVEAEAREAGLRLVFHRIADEGLAALIVDE